MGYDAIVVGSGFGGAVSAARLAERGLRVLVIERGPWWGRGGADRHPDERRPFPRGIRGLRRLVRNVRWARGRRAFERVLAADGLFEAHVFERLTVVTGSGVGGGSLIYTNILEEPAAEFFAAFPDEITAAEMRPYFDRVRAMLRPSPLPEGARIPKTAAFERAVVAAGLGAPRRPDLAVAWEPGDSAAGVAQLACVHCGECIVGCGLGAKTTLDLTYLPRALACGAELRPLTEVLAIGRERGGYRVEARDHRSGQRLELAAPRLVLAAGGLNTQRLLFAARARGDLDGMAALGRRFSPNADMAALIRGARDPVDASYGVTVGAAVSLGRFLIADGGLPLAALPLPGPLRRRLAATGALLAMGADASTGTVRFVESEGALRTEVGRSIDPELFDDMEAACAALGSAYPARRVIANWPAGAGAQAIASVHPLGGAAIAATAADGVVDHTGQVFGHPRLYVADGSLYPRAPGIPPSMTIAALAERQATLVD